ncbi:MAG: lecithin retinol acyltransferase family protein [Sporichthyaceae bacterium]
MGTTPPAGQYMGRAQGADVFTNRAGEIPRQRNPRATALAVGTLVVVDRGYSHLALYLGEGLVVENDDDGVRIRPLAQSAGRDEYSIGGDRDLYRPALFSGLEAAARARLRLGENRYHRVENNCEHFVNWALNGHHHAGPGEVGLGWLFATVDAGGHGERLAAEFPHATEAAIARQEHWLALQSAGRNGAAAAATTLAAFAPRVARVP